MAAFYVSNDDDADDDSDSASDSSYTIRRRSATVSPAAKKRYRHSSKTR